MRTYILIVFLALLGCHTSKNIKSYKDVKLNIISQKKTISISDSLSYMQSIVSNKGKYTHKELGILLNDLVIPIKSYLNPPNFDLRYRTGMIIYFDDFETIKQKSSVIRGATKPIQLYIEWEKPILRSEIQKVLNGAGGNWTLAEQKFYSKLIVSDIK